MKFSLAIYCCLFMTGYAQAYCETGKSYFKGQDNRGNICDVSVRFELACDGEPIRITNIEFDRNVGGIPVERSNLSPREAGFGSDFSVVPLSFFNPYDYKIFEYKEHVIKTYRKRFFIKGDLDNIRGYRMQYDKKASLFSGTKTEIYECF